MDVFRAIRGKKKETDKRTKQKSEKKKPTNNLHGTQIHLTNYYSDGPFASNNNSSNFGTKNYFVSNTNTDSELTTAGPVYGTDLHRLVTVGDTEGIVQAILKGADVNSLTSDGKTPLMAVASNGQWKSVELLIKAGADVNKAAKYGTTALIRAARAGCEQSVNLLIQAGADVNMQEVTTNSAILEASREKSVRSVQLLIKAGARVNTMNSVQEEFLNKRLSINSRKTKMVAMLLFAAGQRLDAAMVTWFGDDFFRFRSCDENSATLEGTSIEWCKMAAFDSSESLSHADNVLSLKTTCRDVIRRQLSFVDPRENLFISVPRLELPSMITNFLLYYVPLED